MNEAKRANQCEREIEKSEKFLVLLPRFFFFFSVCVVGLVWFGDFYFNYLLPTKTSAKCLIWKL